jgi:hypothetical protein
MNAEARTLIDLEEKFWQAMTSFELNDVNVMFPNDATAIVTYRVKQGVSSRDGGKPTTQEMNDSSTWVLEGSRWLCAMHTETPAGQQGST